jgi:hypothetical protein
MGPGKDENLAHYGDAEIDSFHCCSTAQMDVKLSKYGSEFGLIKFSVISYVIFENAAFSMAFWAIQIL